MRELFAQAVQSRRPEDIHMDPVQVDGGSVDGGLGWSLDLSNVNLDNVDTSSFFDLDFSWLGSVLSIYKTITTIIILLLLAILIYTFIRIHEVRKENAKKLVDSLIPDEPDASEQNLRWERVKELFASQSQADWRVAIIEADSMLEDLLIHLGYEGDTVGERLKSIDRANFPALDFAWEAHNVRNHIAHQGMNYSLSSGDAARVMRLYQHVFMDAQYI